MNGTALRVLPPDTQLEDTTVAVGFPSKPEWRLKMLEAIGKVAPKARSVRALGSAALHICYVGAGRLGCFFEHNLKVLSLILFHILHCWFWNEVSLFMQSIVCSS
jgi:myo-inositol-1(or 4)-monophosphatase